MDFTTAKLEDDMALFHRCVLFSLSLSILCSLSPHIFMCFLPSRRPAAQLTVGLRFSVQRLEDVGPVIGFLMQIHR